MAILKGFPPSNLISSTGTVLPDIVEKTIKVGKLKMHERFVSGDSEFMRILGDGWADVRAVCYKTERHHSPGEIYNFDSDKEVIWLRRVYPQEQTAIARQEAGLCPLCGAKIISDLFSTTYGDYCPDENCIFTSEIIDG